MKPLLITSGEPAGIGPDICLALAKKNIPAVVLADKNMLINRAQMLNFDIAFIDYKPECTYYHQENSLAVWHVPCQDEVIAGQLNKHNANHVVNMLSLATKACLKREFSALVTAPVNKAVINEAGIAFTGHTEFLAAYCHVDTVVMMLACATMKMALITTHLPLKLVPLAINKSLIINIVSVLHQSLKNYFYIDNPCILVAGLNPHAGENGYLGQEEIEIIAPAIAALKNKGINVQGPFPADTLFSETNLAKADAFVAMYHDQGLTVLKYASFGEAVNVTLGLPIIRTSVDHGTALTLAGTGKASPDSLLAATEMAWSMACKQSSYA